MENTNKSEHLIPAELNLLDLFSVCNYPAEEILWWNKGGKVKLVHSSKTQQEYIYFWRAPLEHSVDIRMRVCKSTKMASSAYHLSYLGSWKSADVCYSVERRRMSDYCKQAPGAAHQSPAVFQIKLNTSSSFPSVQWRIAFVCSANWWLLSASYLSHKKKKTTHPAIRKRNVEKITFLEKNKTKTTQRLYFCKTHFVPH